MTPRPKTKKLVNAPDDVIAEMVAGMAGAHPDLIRVEGASRRAIVAAEAPRRGKVGIVVGGGSGHEPAFCGYVGRGLADAAVIGNVFASPSPDQIRDAGRAANGGAGLLFLYGNYSGDRMNFDMAAERLGAEGIAVRTVVTSDDVASGAKGERRGIAGGVFVFKAAGAAADLGLPLDEVERLARHANDATATMGVALSPCSLPQTMVANFEIPEGEMEVGMGIHGEPGIERTALESADAVADRLIGPILADLGLDRGDEVALLVNGLGATTLMELYILHRRVAAVLAERGIRIHRSLVGEYVTALEMAGASVTLMRLDAELRRLLDHPCRSLGLTVGKASGAAPALQAGTASGSSPSDAVPAVSVAEPEAETPLVAEGEVAPADFRAMMLAAAERIESEKDRFSALDGVIGDGDHGVTMGIGWRAIRTALDGLGPEATVSAMSRAMSAAFLDAVGASAGPLYATGFLDAGEAVRDRLNLDSRAVAAWIAAMAAGIGRRGGASPGDKTMLDAWAPAAESAARAAEAGAPVATCLEEAARAAEAGAVATAGMEARLGRSAKLGKRSLGHQDPGAASAAAILAAMAEAAPRP